MCRPGIEPGTSHLPGECSTTELPTPLYYLCSPEHILLNYRHPCMRCEASSDDRATALPVIYICSHFDLSSLISMARMQSAPKEDSKSFDAPTGDWTRDPSLAGRVLWPLSYRHLCTICAILSIYYWITDIHKKGVIWEIVAQDKNAATP